MEPEHITAVATNAIQVGDMLTLRNVALSKRERFAMWLRKPWAWPPKRGHRTLIIAAVTNGSIET